MSSNESEVSQLLKLLIEEKKANEVEKWELAAERELREKQQAEAAALREREYVQQVKMMQEQLDMMKEWMECRE